MFDGNVRVDGQNDPLTCVCRLTAAVRRVTLFDRIDFEQADNRCDTGQDEHDGLLLRPSVRFGEHPRQGVQFAEDTAAVDRLMGDVSPDQLVPFPCSL